MPVPLDSASPSDIPRAWRMQRLDAPLAASRAGVQIARVDFDWRLPLASPAYAALSDDERAQLDAYFRPPRSKRALEML